MEKKQRKCEKNLYLKKILAVQIKDPLNEQGVATKP
jgi:hypothetical protein